jgi:hypothetical protein
VEMCRKIGPYEGTISKDNFYQSWWRSRLHANLQSTILV